MKNISKELGPVLEIKNIYNKSNNNSSQSVNTMTNTIPQQKPEKNVGDLNTSNQQKQTCEEFLSLFENMPNQKQQMDSSLINENVIDKISKTIVSLIFNKRNFCETFREVLENQDLENECTQSKFSEKLAINLKDVNSLEFQKSQFQHSLKTNKCPHKNLPHYAKVYLFYIIKLESLQKLLS